MITVWLFCISWVSRDPRRAALVTRKLPEACWDQTALSLQRLPLDGRRPEPALFPILLAPHSAVVSLGADL